MGANNPMPLSAMDGTIYDGNDYVTPKKEKDAIFRSMNRQ